jgi:osmoprotectant transport system permease protein
VNWTIKNLLLFVSVSLLSCQEKSTLPIVVVGSLKDVEGNILGELFAQILENAGEVQVHRELGLGGTGVLFEAFEAKRIDVAPQYSATLANVVLRRPELTHFADIKRETSAFFDVGSPLGFNNTYGIGMRSDVAQKNQLTKLSDLKNHPWRGGVTAEFLDSEHGLPGMVKTYSLNLGQARSMEHVISYVALENGDVDFVDVYTTDASIEQQHLVVLKDDLNFFERYEGLVIAAKGFSSKYPKSWAALEALGGTISDSQMTKLNAELELKKREPSDIAQEFLQSRSLIPAKKNGAKTDVNSKQNQFLTWTLQHLFLVSVSLFLALLLGIPCGIFAGHRPKLGRWMLSMVGVVQTIPGVALLCFFIPLLGIGTPPALTALTLYALLPIVQGMVTGLLATTHSLHEVAAVLGMTPLQKLWRIELPLAVPALLAGVRISAVTTVGTAALAAFIGAGGYGTPIAKGLALADWSLVFQGALPSALLAILAHGLFSLIEKRLVQSE